ncbi:MAG: hypothetical protein HUU50_21045, partial [Candidatus Brocadiae bacterium]|nr:hypothetical protein [Candidatus Brocadiia bacterium]
VQENKTAEIVSPSVVQENKTAEIVSPSVVQENTVKESPAAKPSLIKEKGISKMQQRKEIQEVLPLIRMEVELQKSASAKDKNFLAQENRKIPKKAQKNSESTKSPANAPLENSLFLEPEEKNKKLSEYPVQIARPFLKGEIPQFPQVYIDGSPLFTQADVKCRWEDGSVKHAVLSFIAPVIKTPRSKITFRDQKTGNNDGFESKENMLIHYNFDACMQVKVDEEPQKISAREILKSGHFTYWQKGAVCTSVIIADHSEKRSYDTGSDVSRSFRPVFHATFWPSIKKFKVRFIGEIGNSIALQDQFYELELTLGYRSPKSIYRKEIVQHHAMSRWTKEFWSGDALPKIEIDHNLRYLVATRFVPNYDANKKIPEPILEEYYTSWLSSEKNLFGEGNWAKYMPGTGGRWDIGPYPDWVVYWLYTGDNRMWEMAVGNANLAAAWPMHLREGKAGLFFDSEKKIDALGKVISIQARPSIFLPRFSFTHTTNEDRINPVKELKDHGWIPDHAHQPDPYSVLYMLTGDFWYLEQMYFWASWSAAAHNGGPEVWYGRGPAGCGGIQGEIRGEAWVFRSRVRTAFLAPDGSEEKAYFAKLIEDAIAIWEGQRNITGTSYENTAQWKWGNTIGKGMWEGSDIPALHFWQRGNAAHVNDESVDSNTTLEAIAPWQLNFMMFSLGHARELGYKTDALAKWLAELIVQSVNEFGVDKMSAYRMPTVSKKENKFFANYNEMKDGYNSAYSFKEFFESNLRDPVHGYAYILIPSVAMAKDTGIEGGKEAWNAVKQQILIFPAVNYYPKWVIFPRSSE